MDEGRGKKTYPLAPSCTELKNGAQSLNSPRSLSAASVAFCLKYDLYQCHSPNCRKAPLLAFLRKLNVNVHLTLLNRCHNSFPEHQNLPVTPHLCYFAVQKQSTLAFIDAFVLWYIIHHSTIFLSFFINFWVNIHNADWWRNLDITFYSGRPMFEQLSWQIQSCVGTYKLTLLFTSWLFVPHPG